MGSRACWISRHPKLLLDTLAHEVELVVGVPALDHLALGREAEDAYAVDLHLLAGRCHAPKLALMDATDPPAGDHLVPFGDLVLYCGVEVVEGLAKLGLEPFDVFGAALDDRSVGLVGEVPVEDLVGKVEVARVVISST